MEFCFALLESSQLFIPGIGDETTPSDFRQPIYSFVALLGLLAYEKNLWRVSHLYSECVCDARNANPHRMARVRNWGAGLGCYHQQGKRLLHAGVIGAALLGMMYVTDFKLPSPEAALKEIFPLGNSQTADGRVSRRFE